MQKIVDTGLKLDLHIHSSASSKKDGNKVKNNTLDGKDMKRQLTFDFADNMYSIFEEGTKVFSIDPKDMKFNSLKFYEGIYKAKSSNVSLACSESIDSKGKYIFAWVDSIIQHISNNCGEESDSVDISVEIKPTHKISSPMSTLKSASS